MKFVNRTWEIKELDSYSKPNTLIVLYGRRRVGKTKLITHWLEKQNGVYTQAIEGSSLLQLEQICQDLKMVLSSQMRPQNWGQFFELVEKSVNQKIVICLDEFPYLVESDPTLPSIFQKWIDHNKNHKISFVISGSSQKMMNSLFLSHSSPLYGRAKRILKVEPMTYVDFCEACNLKSKDIENFVLFSMIGGLPRYWEYLNDIRNPIEFAELMYFQRGAILENEPARILSDEKVDGVTPISILEAIGRGSHKSSEISARIGLKQTSLSKVFAQMIDTSLIIRESPFGESQKDSKKSLYKLNDPMLLFWYSVYSGLRSQWHTKSTAEKREILFQFASRVFEMEVRRLHTGTRFWNNHEEYDCVVQLNKKEVEIVEVKFSQLNQKKRTAIENSLIAKTKHSSLNKTWQIKKNTVIDWTDFCQTFK